jgi:hypothetical protein
MAGRDSGLHISDADVADARVLTIDGVLDDTTYVPLRDAIVKTALDEPRVLVVDITRLTVRNEPAWAVFTSARWQIAEWPDTPIGLVCAHEQGRNALRRNGIIRYVPVYSTLESAFAELSADGLRRYRRRARASLPAKRSSIRRCRELTKQWLTAWSRADFVHVVSIVATELVEAALADTDGEFSLRLETDGSTVSVAVQHTGIAEPVRRNSAQDNVSGLDLVAATSRTWGSYATATGHTVWAVVGPENRF